MSVSIAVPAASEPALANQPVASRIAVMIDLLIASVLGIPLGATPVQVSSGNVANAIASATMPAVAAKINYATGFEITGAGATTGLPVTVTLTGVLGGTLSYTYTFAVGALLPNQPLIIEFPEPVPASAANIALVLSCPAGGAGNTNNSVTLHGFVV